MNTPHPELLPVYEFALALNNFLKGHPEAAEAYTSFFGRGILDEIHAAGENIQKGIYNAAALDELLITWSERLLPLAAPGGNWN